MKYANRLLWTDVEPYEVVRVVSDKTLEIRSMNAELDTSVELEFHAGGYVANCSNQHEQKWIITRDETAPTMMIRKRKNGTWGNGSMRFEVADEPRKYYDFNF